LTDTGLVNLSAKRRSGSPISRTWSGPAG